MENVTAGLRFSRRKSREIVLTAVKYLMLTIFAVFFMFPFLVMFFYSFLPKDEALLGVMFSPTGRVNFGPYLKILSDAKYLGYLKNTFLVTILNVLCVPLSASLCAYGFSKMEFKGRGLMFGIMLSTMMLPSIVIQIPLYTMYVKIGWAETFFPLWVPGLLGGGATNIFLMTQFMKGIPNDVTSAAKIDGANSFVIFVRLMIPLCLPVFVYVMVTAFMGSWNDFMTPLLYITDQSKFTLSLGMYRDYGGKIGAENLPNISSAAGIVMMFPCILLFLILQKYLIEGVTVTGLKG